MIENKVTYSFCDLRIVPAVKTDINSRSECNCYYGKDLPLFTAPMDSVADDNNYWKFENNSITPIVHRNVKLEKRIALSNCGRWCAYSFDEFEKLFCKADSEIYKNCEDTVYALIDGANGHMTRVFDLSKNAKKIAVEAGKTLVLMGGNIANPETYLEYCEAGIDYVRCSIGTGSMCLTDANSAVGYGNATLIDEIRKLKDSVSDEKKQESYKKMVPCWTLTKIIADGGCKNFSDINVALALGADYVMCGGIFASFIESCAEVDVASSDYKPKKNMGYIAGIDKFSDVRYRYQIAVTRNMKEAIDEYDELAERYNLREIQFTRTDTSYILPEGVGYVMIPKQSIYKYDDLAKWIVKYIDVRKSSHGMSTKEAQMAHLQMQGYVYDKENLKTSEGKTIHQEVKYTISQWKKNFDHYLRNTMSYCNARTLEEFIGKQKLVLRSYGTMETVNK